MNKISGFGQAQLRVEDKSLLTGKGQFTDDQQPTPRLTGFVVRSQYASGIIDNIVTATARACPGVRMIYTVSDLRKHKIGDLTSSLTGIEDPSHLFHNAKYPILADREIKFVGQPIAFIVADSLAAAKDASELLQIDITPTPVVADLAAARSKSSPYLWPQAKDNRAFFWDHGDKRAATTALAQARYRVNLSLINNRVVANAIENRVCIGEWINGRYRLTTPSQGVHSMRGELSRVFNESKQNFQVISKDVGGGFGNRIPLYPEHVLVLLAARDFDCAVKWHAERSYDSFLSDYQGRDNITELSIGFTEDYLISGYHIRNWANMGAFLSLNGTIVPTECAENVYTGVYQIKQFYAEVHGMYSNTVPVDAYRGAGRPEALYAIERLMDYAARELGQDVITFKQRNLISKKQLPWHCPGGSIYDCGDFPALYQRALEVSNYSGLTQRKQEARQRGKIRGFGIASYIESCGGGSGENAQLSLLPDGKLELLVGMQANGQGHQTSLTQIIAATTGVAIQDIAVIQGDSDRVQRGTATGGSRMLTEAGSVTYRVSMELVDLGYQAAEKMLESDRRDIELHQGRFRIKGTDHGVGWRELAISCRERNEKLQASNHASSKATYPNGCHCCEIEIDPATGQLQLLSYFGLDDFGHILNPTLLAGQIQGGIAQGIGQALLEHSIYDQDGHLLTGSLLDYPLPRADNLISFQLQYDENYPTQNNILGVKGAGEAGTIAAPPAIINAVCDALATVGVHHLDMPATPFRIWRALTAGQLTPSSGDRSEFATI